MKKVKHLPFIIGILSCLILASCSSGKNGSNNVEGKTAGEITIWGWDVAADTLELATEKFNERYPDIKVKVENFNSDDVYEKLTVGLAARGSGLPDVLLMEDERIPSYTNQFPKGFVNLSKLGYDKYEERFSPSKVKSVKNDKGEFIAAPWDVGPAGVFYRVDYFEEAGVDPDSIKTWEDYIEAGKKIKKITGTKLLPIDISKYDGVFHMMLQQQGVSYFNEKGEAAITSDEAIRAMSVIRDLYKNDLVANIDGWDGIVTATVNGKVASVPYGVWYTGTIKDQAPDQKGKWDVFYLPKFKEGGTRYANVGGSSLLIPSSTNNKEAAYSFVEFFTTDVETQMLGFKKYGLFPSLLKTYDDPFFNEESDYFNNSKIFQMFAESVPEVPPITITKDFARASRTVSNAQAAVLLEGESVERELDQAEEKLENEIK
ncbi:ABC transporter substrate-binding protein [Pseudalkalibacillus decolorationis]|uniref:ABC transporter substrate-binding protein n=1 Tax=Pseudalkalibacillus decolorationis TaxID=163879 RepID=UPI0021482C3D|nr:sugar ABC transporter substrate-binding protein [Pseudalkalibacillus decolorationis]